MISIKDTDSYTEVLKEVNYAFGTVYMFKGFVISEFNKGENITWDEHAKFVVDDVVSFYKSDGSNIIYISNRIHSYSVVASDWLKFYKNSLDVKAYCIVSGNKAGFLNLVIEKLFIKNKIKHFTCIYDALNFVKKGLLEVA